MDIPKLGRALPSGDGHEHRTLKFPPNFLWGTASAAHQVEGGNERNDWWQWEKIPGRIADGVRSGSSADHYHRYVEDIRLAKAMNLNAERLSIEWSRIEPSEGTWDTEAIEHYRTVLRTLKEERFTVTVTLWHFTLPEWVAAQGGFENRKTLPKFLRFVRKMGEEYGSLVDIWVTMNEPMIYVTQGYVYGLWPPGKKSLWQAVKVFRNLTAAHRRAYRAFHEILDEKGGKAIVGIAKNVISFDPYRKHSLPDVWFVKFADWLWNHSFFSRTRGAHDFIGINYYFHYRVAFVPTAFNHFFMEVRNENREVSDVGWEVYSPGLFAAIQDMAVYRKPIYITENGIASVNDDKRVRFLVSHLKEVYHAIESGVEVRGYFYWSLLDNFEWEKGFRPRFGLIEIDYSTMERRPRRSASIYGEIAKTNGISHDLLRFLGHEI